MNKIEAVIELMKDCIDTKLRKKAELVAEIDALVATYSVIERIKRDESIPNEENQLTMDKIKL